LTAGILLRELADDPAEPREQFVIATISQVLPPPDTRLDPPGRPAAKVEARGPGRDMDMDEATIGARVRTLRRWRGMSQDEVADLAGMSRAFLSLIENGKRSLDRRTYIAGIAAALRVSETDLVGGPHLSADRLQSDPHAGIPALRDALQLNTLTAPAGDRARPLPELVAELRDTITPPFRIATDYIRVGGLLPAVIDELHVHTAAPRDEAAHRLALETMVDACIMAALMCWGLDHFDLAFQAATRAREAASTLGDPVQEGKADWAWLVSLPRTGALPRKLAAAQRVAAALEPCARDPLGLQVLGMITLTASMAAAAVQDHATSEHWMSEAGSLAARVPDDPAANWQFFSATNVGVWRLAVAVERGEAGSAVLERARQVNLDLLPPRSHRRAAFLADGGRGLARDPRTQAEAVRWLRQAEAAAPQRIRNSTAVRETIAFLLQRSRTDAGGRELRGMAARMGIPH
jgi:transcriptional regulator with XRE-family HTH domain